MRWTPGIRSVILNPNPLETCSPEGATRGLQDPYYRRASLTQATRSPTRGRKPKAVTVRVLVAVLRFSQEVQAADERRARRGRRLYTQCILERFPRERRRTGQEANSVTCRISHRRQAQAHDPRQRGRKQARIAKEVILYSSKAGPVDGVWLGRL